MARSMRRILLQAIEHLRKLVHLFWRHLFAGHLFDHDYGLLQRATFTRRVGKPRNEDEPGCGREKEESS